MNYYLLETIPMLLFHTVGLRSCKNHLRLHKRMAEKNILQTDDALIDVFGNENVSKSFDFFVGHCLSQVFFCSLGVNRLLGEFTFSAKTKQQQIEAGKMNMKFTTSRYFFLVVLVCRYQ